MFQSFKTFLFKHPVEFASGYIEMENRRQFSLLICISFIDHQFVDQVNGKGIG